MIKRKHILLIFALLFPGPLLAEEVSVAGLYGNMPIAYDKATGVISGYVHESTGAGQFSCIFYFSGRLQGHEAKIVSYYPDTPTEKIDGMLAFSELPHKELKIKLKEEHGGCWNVEHFADSDPASFSMGEAHASWRAIDVVKSKKAYFYSAPQSASRLSSYLVQGDAVAITGEHGDWYQIEYKRKKLTSGYIHKSDLYRLSSISNARFSAPQ